MTSTFYYEHGLIVLSALITGTKKKNFPVLLAIDTGSYLTIINPDVLQKVGVAFSNQQTVLHGISEKTNAPLGNIHAIEIAGVSTGNLPVASHQLSTDYPIDGVVGNSFFLQHKLFIDFPNKIISIE